MQKLAEFLEREGGHVAALIFLTLCFLGVAICAPKDSLAAKLVEDGFAFGIGAMSYAMKANGNKSKDQSSPKQP